MKVGTEKGISRKQEEVAEILSQLEAKFFESKQPTDSDLATVFAERARIAEEDDGAEKPRCGITWPSVCASQSDISLSKKDDVSIWLSTKSTCPISGVVDELLPVLKSDPIFGRKYEKNLLLSQLLAPNQGDLQLSAISIFGVSGIGKTTLARLVYEDETVQKHFEVKPWVNVAGQEMDQLSGIAREIIRSATGMRCTTHDLVELDAMVRDVLLSQKSLIVLDEIEHMNVDSWPHMKHSWFNVVGLGSKVIITTSSNKVAGVVSTKPFELRELSPDDGWSLYCSLAFDSSKVINNARFFDPTALKLVAQCNGMPLSLKLLGSLVRFDESLKEVLSSDYFMDRIVSSLNTLMVLFLSILALPRDLFRCFAYCAIFPRGYALNRKKLIMLWIAEGFVKPMTETISLEDTGDAYFNQLLCRSFFTDITCDEYGDVVQVRMPGAIHQFAQEIARIVCGRKVDNSDRNYLVLQFGEEYDSRHISPPTKNLGVALNRPSVQFKRLRSLDLSCSGIQELSSHISVLRRLRYLSLSHTPITSLPNSITRLVRLETLDLSSCYYLRVLPKKMPNLKQLRHFDLSQCNSLSYVPCGIGLLSSLKSMPLFVLGQSECAGLGELQKLHGLEGKLHIRNLENVKEIGEARDADLKHKDLDHLELSWSHIVDECYRVLECLQPNPKLRVLDLSGYGAYGFPSWIPTIYSLIKISITDCRCTKLPTLGQLPKLQELLLKGLANVRTIGQEFYGDDVSKYVFPSLEMLKLYGMPKLNRWSSATAGDGHSASRLFPSLKTLTVEGCPLLKKLPPLPSVTDLVVWNSNSEILSSLTSIRSLSSLLINDMRMGESFGGLNGLCSVKKLIVVHGTDLDDLSIYRKFTALGHMVIQHCLKLKSATLFGLSSLQKLNIVDCENLRAFKLPTGTSFSLTELVIEDCPQLESIVDNRSLATCLGKLTVRNCPLLRILPRRIKKIRGLEYLFISGCPWLEERLKEERAMISHVRCVILGDERILSGSDD